MASNASDLERKLDDALKDQFEVSRLQADNHSLTKCFSVKETEMRAEMQVK